MASRLAQLVAKELLLGPDSGTLGENELKMMGCDGMAMVWFPEFIGAKIDMNRSTGQDQYQQKDAKRSSDPIHEFKFTMAQCWASTFHSLGSRAEKNCLVMTPWPPHHRSTGARSHWAKDSSVMLKLSLVGIVGTCHRCKRFLSRPHHWLFMLNCRNQLKSTFKRQMLCDSAFLNSFGHEMGSQTRFPWAPGTNKKTGNAFGQFALQLWRQLINCCAHLPTNE